MIIQSNVRSQSNYFLSLCSIRLITVCNVFFLFCFCTFLILISVIVRGLRNISFTTTIAIDFLELYAGLLSSKCIARIVYRITNYMWKRDGGLLQAL